MLSKKRKTETAAHFPNTPSLKQMKIDHMHQAPVSQEVFRNLVETFVVETLQSYTNSCHVLTVKHKVTTN